jgi:hypothetical protein
VSTKNGGECDLDRIFKAGVLLAFGPEELHQLIHFLRVDRAAKRLCCEPGNDLSRVRIILVRFRAFEKDSPV